MEHYKILCSKAIKLNIIINNLNNGSSIVRDMSLLESAIGNVYQSMFGEDLYKTPEEKAYMLFINIARNHPFFDGNKRTAALISDYFLMENNLELNLDDNGKFALLINILEKHIDLESGLAVFKTLVKPLESLNKKTISEELKKDFIKQINNISSFLEESKNEDDLKELVKNNFIKSFSSKNNINYNDLVEIYKQELSNDKFELNLEK